VYAVIDSENAFPNEIHKNNNEGWAPVMAIGSVTSVPPIGELPHQFVLYQCFPNPFNPVTTIRYDLPHSAHISLKVYNVLGEEVITLADEVRSAGSHEVQLNATGLASGVYFYRMQAGSFAETRKFVLLK
jgi:hypothetical protein